MEQEIKRFIEIAKRISPKSFINDNNELIVVPSNNIYFRLEDVKTELELKCKIIAWLSRPSCKGISDYWQKRVRAIVNEYLGTDFNRNQMSHIYAFLGNDCSRKRCIEFIESGYDFSLLPEGN